MVDPTQNPDSTSKGTGNTPDSQDTAPAAIPKNPVVDQVDKPKKKQPSPKKTKKFEEHEASSSSSSEDESGSSSSDESTNESTSPPETASSDTSESESGEEQRRTRKSKTKRSRRRNQKKTKQSRAHRADSTTESVRSYNGLEDSSKDNQQLPVPQTEVLPGTQGAESTDLILALAKRLAAMEAELNEARRNQNNAQCNHTTGQKEESTEDEPKKSKKDKIKIGTKVEFKRVDQRVFYFPMVSYIPQR